MTSKLGLGVLSAGLLALATSAQAAPQSYSGLAFNSLDRGSSYTRIGNEAFDAAFGGIRANDPVESDLGQFNYTIDLDALPGSSGDPNHVITFGASSPGKSIWFGDYEMTIRGGRMEVEHLATAATPTRTLPFGYGFATPDYELERGHLDVTLNGVDMTFYLCEQGGFGGQCAPYGDDRPWGEGQPYNTLNVGDENESGESNDTDLAFFVYMRGECNDLEDCPFQPSWEVYTRRWGWVTDRFGWCSDLQRDVSFRDETDSGVITGGAQTTAMVGTGGGGEWEPECRLDNDIYMKMAFWGTGGTDAPEPATLSLFGLGLAGLGMAVRRRRKAA